MYKINIVRVVLSFADKDAAQAAYESLARGYPVSDAAAVVVQLVDPDGHALNTKCLQFNPSTSEYLVFDRP